MSRRLRILAAVTTGETVALAVWAWWMDRRASQIADLLEVAYAAHGPVSTYPPFIFPTPVLPLADRTPSKEPE